MPKLKQLALPKADIPPDDVEELRTELPGVKIEWQPSTEDDRKFLQTYLGR